MHWGDVRQAYPSQWVLIEAINARTEGNKRIIDEIMVVDNFDNDGGKAFQRYVELHKKYNSREYFIYHTSHANLDIGVKRWLGVRPG